MSANYNETETADAPDISYSAGTCNGCLICNISAYPAGQTSHVEHMSAVHSDHIRRLLHMSWPPLSAADNALLCAELGRSTDCYDAILNVPMCQTCAYDMDLAPALAGPHITYLNQVLHILSHHVSADGPSVTDLGAVHRECFPELRAMDRTVYGLEGLPSLSHKSMTSRYQVHVVLLRHLATMTHQLTHAQLKSLLLDRQHQCKHRTNVQLDISANVSVPPPVCDLPSIGHGANICQFSLSPPVLSSTPHRPSQRPLSLYYEPLYSTPRTANVEVEVDHSGIRLDTPQPQALSNKEPSAESMVTREDNDLVQCSNTSPPPPDPVSNELGLATRTQTEAQLTLNHNPSNLFNENESAHGQDCSLNEGATRKRKRVSPQGSSEWPELPSTTEAGCVQYESVACTSTAVFSHHEDQGQSPPRRSSRQSLSDQSTLASNSASSITHNPKLDPLRIKLRKRIEKPRQNRYPRRSAQKVLLSIKQELNETDTDLYDSGMSPANSTPSSSTSSGHRPLKQPITSQSFVNKNMGSVQVLNSRTGEYEKYCVELRDQMEDDYNSAHLKRVQQLEWMLGKTTWIPTRTKAGK